MSTDGKTRNKFGQRFGIWNISSCGGNISGHPAPFPEQLAYDHIISWSNENNVILDPMMGSGTTGVACKNLKRKFIGIEKDEKYFEIAKNRIENSKYKPIKVNKQSPGLIPWDNLNLEIKS